MRTLTELELQRYTPSVFSTESNEKTSAKYSVIPTIEVVRGLQNAGFYPVLAQQARVRDQGNKPFTKHMLRFRHHTSLEKGGNTPEIVLINSHDGKSSYQLRGGIYRIACMNGLIVGNEYCHFKIRHQGDVVGRVIDSANEIVQVIPRALDVAEEWKGITLDHEQRKVYAQSALMLKYEGSDDLLQTPERFLQPKRQADTSKDLWTTFNVIQEHLIRGGTRYFDAENYQYRRTRGVNSITENAKLNTALWNLTEKMAQLTK
jgi:hypothetical protein